MSSITKFNCNFCNKELTDRSINPERMGYCQRLWPKFEKDNWTNRLKSNINGPHICCTCVTEIMAKENSMEEYN